jgi:hypothetical protein
VSHYFPTFIVVSDETGDFLVLFYFSKVNVESPLSVLTVASITSQEYEDSSNVSPNLSDWGSLGAYEFSNRSRTPPCLSSVSGFATTKALWQNQQITEFEDLDGQDWGELALRLQGKATPWYLDQKEALIKMQAVRK